LVSIGFLLSEFYEAKWIDDMTALIMGVSTGNDFSSTFPLPAFNFQNGVRGLGFFQRANIGSE
jgi:hypothetical protein